MNELPADIAIRVRDLSVRYRVNFRENARDMPREFYSLRQIGFDVRRGEILGVIGENGSGKTTLLELLAGVLKPDAGTIETQGSVSAILDIGAGLDPDFSGRENVENILALCEPDRAVRQQKVKLVIEFADLGDFIDASVKHYSQGMQVRLGFALAVHVAPDILLIDEVISVGDLNFQIKSMRKISEFIRSGKTVVLASHDTPRIAPLCHRILLLKGGRVLGCGPPVEMIDLYNQISGPRAAVAFCTREPAGLVFNGGRVFLRWGGRSLTPYEGLVWFSDYFSFRESSQEMDWEVVEAQADRVTAHGLSPRTGMRQTLSARLLEDGGLELRLECRPGATRPRKIETLCLLDPELRRWTFSETQGALARDAGQEVVHRTLSDPRGERAFCLVSAPEEGGEDLPEIFWDATGSPDPLRFEIEGSAFKTLALRAHSAVLGRDREVFEFEWTARLSCDPAAGARMLEAKRQESTAANDAFALRVTPGCVALRLRGREISCAEGVRIFFHVPELDRRVDSTYAHWAVTRRGAAVRAQLTWNDLPGLSVVLEADVSAAGQLLWTVQMHSAEGLRVRELLVEFLFESFFSRLSYGGREVALERPAAFPSPLALDRYTPTVVRLDADPAQSLTLATRTPGMVHYFLLDRPPDEAALPRLRVVALHNGPADGTDVCLQYRMLGSGEPVASEPPVRAQAGLVPLRLEFEDGSVTLVHQGVTITTGLALYASVCRADGVWIDSRQAHWTLEESAENRLAICGLFPWVDLRQTWELVLDGRGGLSWSVQADADGRWPSISRCQFGLMASPQYRRWSAGESSGWFEKCRDEDAGWQEIYRGADTRLGLPPLSERRLLRRRPLPGVVFDLLQAGVASAVAKVEQVCRPDPARVLIYELDCSQTRPRGRTALFSGRLVCGGGAGNP